MRGENECRGSLLRVRQWVGLEGNMQYHAMASLYLWQVFIFANIQVRTSRKQIRKLTAHQTNSPSPAPQNNPKQSIFYCL